MRRWRPASNRYHQTIPPGSWLQPDEGKSSHWFHRPLKSAGPNSLLHEGMKKRSSFAAWLTPGKAFICSLLLAMGSVLVPAAWSSAVQARALARIAPHRLADRVEVTSQLQVEDMVAVGRRYRMVVDLRPDGEALDQPSSQAMEHAARMAGLGFAYVPVPHGDIPDDAVARLQSVLAAQGDVLLYCRSGKRAARTWALAEARRPGGLSAEQIQASVQGAGQDAADLRDRIDRAINARPKVKS